MIYIEKMFFDDAVDKCIELVDERIELLECRLAYDVADTFDMFLLGELDDLKEKMEELKYFNGGE